MATKQATKQAGKRASAASEGGDGGDSTVKTGGTDPDRDSPEGTDQEGKDNRGIITAPTAGGGSPGKADARARAKAVASRVFQRLNREGRWTGAAEQTKNDMIAEAKAKGVPAAEAKERAYNELNRLYPLLPPPEPAPAEQLAPAPDVGRVRGLGDIPDGWPDLPATASLQGDLQWVQSNRLVVVEEQASGATRVHLGRAHEPAPSRAALGWLETSIRSYAKYVDVVARSLATVQDEQEQVKRERMRIEEIKELLAEMRREHRIS